MKRLYDLFNGIERDTRTCILHDVDLDGVMSAFLFKKALQDMGFSKITLRHHENSEKTFIEEDVDFFKNKGCGFAVCLDLSGDEEKGLVYMIEDFARILIVDHHPLINDVSSSRTVLIKASDLSDIPPSQYPTCKMVYDLLGQFVSMRKYGWLCCLGILADSAEERWKGFIDSFVKKEERLDFERAERLLEYACISRKTGGIDDAFSALEKARNYKDIIRALLKYEGIEKEIESLFERFDKEKEEFKDKDLIIWGFESKNDVKTPLANRISKLYPNMTIILVRKGSIYIIGARRSDGEVDVGELMRKIAKEIPGVSGGGHRPSAGARVPEEKYKEFKKRLIDLL